MDGAPRTARARARAELTEEIKAAGRRQLADVGAADLSLRAVARELGMASSAVYRYVASRDDLLTLLLVDAYDVLGAAVEEAAAVRRGGFATRWSRTTGAVRDWARHHPHEYALAYGSPVPGYQAPPATISPAARPAVAMLGVVADGLAAGEVRAEPTRPMARALHADLAHLRDEVASDLPDEVLARALFGWTQLFGAISFELFGHLYGVITDADALFAHHSRRAADLVATG